MRSVGCGGVQLEAGAVTDERALGRAALPAQFRHIEFEVLLRHTGGVGWQV